MEFICKMDKVSVLENKGIYSFKIYSEQEELDSFIIDCKKRIVNKPLSKITSKILKIKPNNYNYYRKYLLSNHYDINFNETIWIPKDEDKCFILNTLTCEVEDINYSKCNTTEYLKKNYLIFPTKELATKSMYFNHLERLQILYQYENDLLFVPTWGGAYEQLKYHITYDTYDGELTVCSERFNKSHNVYWEDKEELKIFINKYRKEIIKYLNY